MNTTVGAEIHGSAGLVGPDKPSNRPMDMLTAAPALHVVHVCQYSSQDDEQHLKKQDNVLKGHLVLDFFPFFLGRGRGAVTETSPRRLNNCSCVRMRLICILTVSLLTVSHLVSATVSNSFRDCSQFFYMQTPPAGVRGTSLKKICQRYADEPRYATLYDGSRHLPLYSAYVFKKSDGKRRADTPWMYEPQVETHGWMHSHRVERSREYSDFFQIKHSL